MKCNVDIEVNDIAWANVESLVNHFKITKTVPEEGEIFRLVSGEVYVYHEGEFNQIKMENSGLNINLYDLNKSAVAEFPGLDERTIWERCKDYAKEIVKEFGDNYYMLYGKDIGYFTLFHLNESKGYNYFSDDLEDCLNNLSSSIKVIEWNEDKTAIEIWLEYNGDITCMYLFPYDAGVIETREV